MIEFAAGILIFALAAAIGGFIVASRRTRRRHRTEILEEINNADRDTADALRARVDAARGVVRETPDTRGRRD